MSEPLAQLTASLRVAGYSLTRPRRIVFRALQGTEQLSMSELITACPDVDRASIYRTILLFEQLRIVQRLHTGWKYKLELTGEFIRHHHHLSCTRCGKLIALPEDTDLERRLITLAASQKFLATDHQLEIRGVCTHCQAKA